MLRLVMQTTHSRAKANKLRDEAKALQSRSRAEGGGQSAVGSKAGGGQASFALLQPVNNISHNYGSEAAVSVFVVASLIFHLLTGYVMNIVWPHV